MEEEEVEEVVSRFFDGSAKGYIFVGVMAAAAGVALGYFLGRKNEPTYHVIPPQKDFDYDELEEFVREKEKEAGIISPEKGNIVAKGRKFIETTKTGTEVVLEVGGDSDSDEPLITQNVFEHNDTWDYEVELLKRNENAPYVIHTDEFAENEHDYTQHTLTYYAGDDILADEHDAPVYNHAQIIGELKFGHGSGDPNTFYVRNDKMKAEYEILLEPGLFSVEVMGLEIEDNERVKGLKHSGVPKFRTE